ncbi:E3 ubiquitin-protein ligase Siah2 [Folsomia candida]|uniref:E3 ubiquitin-protein ligase Siah2 n=2 Tax=Folsomia candida TaxID=158441 RepID=A0A226D9X2_FOLCA|nr:E3 ubiquitin-protein ligase Siah2 [Folsomia candida]
MQNKKARRKLRAALDCTICLDSPASPINRCQNGHIVCGICAGKVGECGVCKTKLQVSVMAERLSRQLDLKCNCPYFESGCVNPVAAADVKDHLAKCYFRDVTCEFAMKQSDWEDVETILHAVVGLLIDTNHDPAKRREALDDYCGRYGGKIPISLRDYPAHLRNVHQIEFHEIVDGKWISMDYLTEMDGARFEASPTPHVNEVMQKNGHIFLFHSCNDAELERNWVTILGDAKEAEKYAFQVEISSLANSGSNMEQSFTIPVLAYHDHTKLSMAEITKNSVVIPACHYAQFGITMDSEPNNCLWLHFEFTIVEKP